LKWEQANKHGNLKIRIPAIFRVVFSVVFGTHSTIGDILAFLKQYRIIISMEEFLGIYNKNVKNTIIEY